MEESTSETNKPRKLLLVGWDAAEWTVVRPLVNAGLMPNLTRLIEGGVSGNLAAGQPLVSPLVWASIVTGKRPYKHGVLGTGEPRSDKLDTRPISSHARSTKALWNILSQSGKRVHCVNAYASAPADSINGVFVPREFILGSITAESAPFCLNVEPDSFGKSLEVLRIAPTDLDASLLLHFLPNAAKLNDRRDPRLHIVASALAETATTHAIACDILQHQEWDFTAVTYTALETISHAFMRFHPPKLEEISGEEFNEFGDVVQKTYRLCDMMLGRLAELAGPDATVLVVSDHGFVTGRSRASMKFVRDEAGAMALHRGQGMFVLKGPSIIADELLEGATVYDVAPTVLTLFGLPSAADMDGRPLMEALVGLPMPERVPSWDSVAGDSGMVGPEQLPEVDESISYLAELGYKETPSPDAQQRLNAVRDDIDFNTARSLIDARRPAEALPFLERLVRLHPDNPNYARSLFESYIACGRLDDARAVVQRSWDRGFHGTLQHLGFAMVDVAENRFQSALDHLRHVQPESICMPGVNLLIGRAYLRLRNWEEADRAFQQEIAEWPENASALTGRAAVALETGKYQPAAEIALQAIGLKTDFAEAHHALGIALMKLHRPQESAIALRRCLQ
ncbi:MAG: type phosphodiesterase/nucleotide pyrophosphatase, partial [Phycisphaerales bacterium]|nr:type phosphodiesterase/nucleotide pyrophosphatase [Phycisphaerales bacterium]